MSLLSFTHHGSEMTSDEFDQLAEAVSQQVLDELISPLWLQRDRELKEKEAAEYFDSSSGVNSLANLPTRASNSNGLSAGHQQTIADVSESSAPGPRRHRRPIRHSGNTGPYRRPRSRAEPSSLSSNRVQQHGTPYSYAMINNHLNSMPQEYLTPFMTGQMPSMALFGNQSSLQSPLVAGVGGQSESLNQASFQSCQMPLPQSPFTPRHIVAGIQSTSLTGWSFDAGYQNFGATAMPFFQQTATMPQTFAQTSNAMPENFLFIPSTEYQPVYGSFESGANWATSFPVDSNQWAMPIDEQAWNHMAMPQHGDPAPYTTPDLVDEWEFEELLNGHWPPHT